MKAKSVLKEAVDRLKERKRRGHVPRSIYGPGLHICGLAGVHTLHKGGWSLIRTSGKRKKKK